MPNVEEFQTWMNTKGASLTVDGGFGPKSTQAALQVFTNLNPSLVTDIDIQAVADRLSVSTKQVRAVAKVESSGSGFDPTCKPKILFERHFFHRITKGRFDSVTPNISNVKAGGYGPSSTQWDRLMIASKHDPEAAFRSVSWGKFQVMGDWFDEFRFGSPWDMAFSCVNEEFGHYSLLALYVEMANLQGAMRALSADPSTCRAFASGYNGRGYAKNSYDMKLAKAMV
jgi:N-acetylmuramidase